MKMNGERYVGRNEVTKNEFEKLVLDKCYDRCFCKLLKIDYNNITNTDVRLIKDYLNLYYKIRGGEDGT